MQNKLINSLTQLFANTPRRKQVAISGGIIGIALLTSASIFATGPNASPAAHIEKAWPVSVIPAQPQRLQPTFTAFGRLESNQVATLRSDLVAKIETVHVKEGDWVNKGDVLITLDNREANLKVLERKAELRQQQANLSSMRTQLELEQQSAAQFESKFQISQAKLKRHQDLMAKRLISKGLLDEVVAQANQASIDYRNHVRELSNLPNQIAAHEAGVAMADAHLAQAKLDLEKTEIKAPFAGPVLAVHAAPGVHSNLSLPLVEMADNNGFEVRVQIPDAYTHHFANTKLANNIKAVAESGAALQLVRVASHVRSGQTGMDAFFAYTDEDATAPALGRVFSVSIALPAEDRLIPVPVQSIYENNRIYAVVDNRLVGYNIQRVGELESPELGYQILIRSEALESGAPIITTALPRAITGLLVDVANAEVAQL